MPKPNIDLICASLKHGGKEQVLVVDDYAELFLPTVNPDCLAKMAGVKEVDQPDPFEP